MLKIRLLIVITLLACKIETLEAGFHEMIAQTSRQSSGTLLFKTSDGNLELVPAEWMASSDWLKERTFADQELGKIYSKPLAMPLTAAEFTILKKWLKHIHSKDGNKRMCRELGAIDLVALEYFLKKIEPLKITAITVLLHFELAKKIANT